jgi:two-component system OmpR family response regulator
VLVVEDNARLASFLVRALGEEGHVVDQVADGKVALQQLEAGSYDVVVLDWMLPGMDGLAVCRTARSRGIATPILMLTARTDVDERILGLDAGADDYLSKPFDLGELLARVRALGRRTGQPASVLRVGPLSIDRMDRRATVDGVAVDLTGRELALLTYFAAHAGRTIGRMELLAKVWSMTHDPGSNVVEVHVKHLRDKLGPYGKMIETVRGAGYRLVAQ